MKKANKNSSVLPLVSVVIPMFNAEKFIVKAVKSVLKTNYVCFEVIVIDDQSTDKSWQLVNKHFGNDKKVILKRNNKRLLAAGSRNSGIALAKGEYVALLDHDIEVQRNWLKEAIKVFQRHPDAGTVQGVVLDMTRRTIIQHAGIMINAYLGWVISKGFGKSIRVYKPKEEEVFANATGLIFKKEAWREVGGFDESLAINTDDWDFNWRCWLYGYKQVLSPKSITYHWSKKQKMRDKWIKRLPWEFHFAKVPWLFIKNYQTKNVFRFLPVYLFVNFLRGLFNLIFRFNPAPLFAYFGAIGWTIGNLSELLERRRIVQKKRVTPDSYLIDNVMDKSFILDYFVKHWLPIVRLGRLMSTEYEEMINKAGFQCLVCEGEEFSVKKARKYRYLTCTSCGLATLTPRKKALKETESIYNEEYFDWQEASGFKKLLFKIPLYEKYASWVNRESKRQGKLLDVGAGIYDFVKAMKEKGWDPYALELSKKQVKKIISVLGTKRVYCGRFEMVRLPEKHFDLVTLWHVLEHFEDPKAALKKIKRILKKEGKVYLEVPNVNSFTWSIFGDNYDLLRLPEHLFYFNKKSLQELFESQGFKVIGFSYPVKLASAFSFSLSNVVRERFNNRKLVSLVFYLSIPFSVFLSIVMSFIGKSELVRMVAVREG